jgi:hypothetical protein
MQELKHALTGGIYGIDPEDGLVRVEEAGKVGWFDYRGRWQRGGVVQADPDLCDWLGGPGATGSYDKPFKTIPLVR